MRADLYDYNFLNTDDEHIDLDIESDDNGAGDIMVKSTTKFCAPDKDEENERQRKEEEEEDDDDEAEFHDAYEDPKQLFEEENKQNLLKKKQKMDLKGKLIKLGSEKSRLSLQLVSLPLDPTNNLTSCLKVSISFAK